MLEAPLLSETVPVCLETWSFNCVRNCVSHSVYCCVSLQLVALFTFLLDLTCISDFVGYHWNGISNKFKAMIGKRIIGHHYCTG